MHAGFFIFFISKLQGHPEIANLSMTCPVEQSNYTSPTCKIPALHLKNYANVLYADKDRQRHIIQREGEREGEGEREREERESERERVREREREREIILFRYIED